MSVQNKEKGFTIIEVVLVLAIAGLIFLMVFIALPALQRSQRDTQRKNDMSRVQTQLNSFQSNNRGQLPADSGTNSWGTQDSAGTATPPTSLLARYLRSGGDEFRDPSGKPYTFTTAALPATPTSDATDNSVQTVRIFVTRGAVCNGEALTTGQGDRKVAFRVVLEGGGVSCVSN